MTRPLLTMIGTLVASATLALAVLVPAAAAARPAAAAARSCSVPRYPGSGYFTSLTVKGVGCATGRKVVRAHYRCRTRSGPAGRCPRRVLRYRCSEHRGSIPTEIDSRVNCQRGARRVFYSYQQNL
jgi:hypothetical protein